MKFSSLDTLRTPKTKKQPLNSPEQPPGRNIVIPKLFGGRKRKVFTRSQSYHRTNKIVLCQWRRPLQDRFRAKKVNFGKNPKNMKKAYIMRGNSTGKYKSFLGAGGGLDISSIVPKNEENQKIPYFKFVESEADETLNDLISLLNHPTESISAQGSPKAGQPISPLQKNSKKLTKEKSKKSLSITTNELKTRTSPLIKSAPKFRIIKKSHQTIKLPTEPTLRPKRKGSHQINLISTKHLENQRGSMFLTRIRKKAKTILIKSPKKRKSAVCGFFEENKLKEQKCQFLRFSRSPRDHSSSSFDQEDEQDDLDEESVSKIEILEDEDFLTNNRQRRRTDGF